MPFAHTVVRTRVRWAALVALVVVGSLVSWPTAATANPPRPDDAELAIVPLDDRPANVYFPEMTAASAGVDTVFPPAETIGTFTTPGDGEEVGRWLMSQDDADGFVVSASMLAYGGLIASRTGTLPEATARENVAVLRELRNARPDVPIYVYDTIQRLAVTALGGDAERYYSLIRRWAILVDRVENLGHEELRAQLDEVRAQIPDDVIEDYLAARARNHQINRLLIEWAAEGVIDYLVLAQDDAAPYGLHREEREALAELVDELGVADRVQIFPGADEVDATLVSRFVQQQLGAKPTVSVEYSGLPGSEWIAPFEDTTFDVNVRRHLDAAGAVEVEGGADIRLMVNTPSAGGADRGADLDAFVGRMAAARTRGEAVIVVDAAEVNRSDADLVERMEAQVEVAELLAYSGWNTAGNALGIAAGHGLARWAFIERSDRGAGVPALLPPANAHASYLLHRFTLDDRWKNTVQPDAYSHAQARGWNVFGLDPAQTRVMEEYVRDALKPAVKSFYAEHFDGVEVVLGRRGARTHTGVVDGLDAVQISLPWPRLFETRLEPEISLRWPAGR